MARQAFPYTTFSDPSGSVLSNGYVLLRISQDVNSPSGLIGAGMELNVALDQNGVMVNVPQVWPNASLQPSGTCYLYSAFAADGQLVLGPESVVI